MSILHFFTSCMPIHSAHEAFEEDQEVNVRTITGHSVTLTCHVKPQVNAINTTWRWMPNSELGGPREFTGNLNVSSILVNKNEI